ncbi:MAG TPA: 50S ribosomal protein L15 [Candidatus Dormibacteraeota bacterium]|nr:50S ribosomal protein L15 [Candidatus Dormibacteraeota bacterium]
MKYNQLTIVKSKSPKRVGRGIAAGQGKTAGRGTKGQKSRTGYSKRPGFEGGQNPLMQRLPKLPGFKSHRTKAEVIYSGQLDSFAPKTIDNLLLAEAGLINSAYSNVKLINKGKLTKKLTVKLQGASKSVVATIEEAGGNFVKTPRIERPVTSKNPKKQAVVSEKKDLN